MMIEGGKKTRSSLWFRWQRAPRPQKHCGPRAGTTPYAWPGGARAHSPYQNF